MAAREAAVLANLRLQDTGLGCVLSFRHASVLQGVLPLRNHPAQLYSPDLIAESDAQSASRSPFRLLVVQTKRVPPQAACRSYLRL